jgi:hypothetical protein
LYIGISGGFVNRIRDHRLRSEWFRDAVKFTLERYPTKEAAKYAEGEAIATEKPLHNTLHNLWPAKRVVAPYKTLGTRKALVKIAVDNQMMYKYKNSMG